MIAVLTGDIVNSREGDVLSWMDNLKKTLATYGKTPNRWEIFRGDSFQLSIDPESALEAAFHIKASVKQMNIYDVRIAVGLGNETYSASKITESNGSAYVRSGECFDSLKKYLLAVNSGNEQWDLPINIMLILALQTANGWSTAMARIVEAVITNPDKNQKEIAVLLNKSQSTISETYKRSGFEEILKINSYYQRQLAFL